MLKFCQTQFLYLKSKKFIIYEVLKPWNLHLECNPRDTPDEQDIERIEMELRGHSVDVSLTPTQVGCIQFISTSLLKSTVSMPSKKDPTKRAKQLLAKNQSTPLVEFIPICFSCIIDTLRLRVTVREPLRGMFSPSQSHHFLLSSEGLKTEFDTDNLFNPMRVDFSVKKSSLRYLTSDGTLSHPSHQLLLFQKVTVQFNRQRKTHLQDDMWYQFNHFWITGN